MVYEKSFDLVTLTFDVEVEVAEFDGHWVGRVKPFGITVHAKTSTEAEQRATLAVKQLGSKLQSVKGGEDGVDDAVEYLNARGIKHTKQVEHIGARYRPARPSTPRTYTVKCEQSFEVSLATA